MPAQVLRHSQSGGELHRRTTLDLLTIPAPELDDLPSRGTVSAEFRSQDRPIGAGQGPSLGDSSRLSANEDSSFTTAGPSRPSQDSTWSRPWSFYKGRYASDPQLAAKVRQQREQKVPPVPALPSEPPLIVTTSPTSELASQSDKRKSRFPIFSRPKASSPPALDPTKERRGADRKTPREKKKAVFGSLRVPRDHSDGPQRGAQSLDLNTLTSEAQADEPPGLLAPPASDRDGSSQGSSQSLAVPDTSSQMRPKYAQPKNWIPRRKKNRGSLFPLPVRMPPPEFPNTAPATPRASTSGISTSGSPNRSPEEHSRPSSTLHRVPTADGVPLPPLPNPQFTLAAASVSLAAPVWTLFKNESASGQSDAGVGALAPRIPHRPRRHRASTLGSLGARSEDVPMSPPTPPTLGGGSGRNSTSTGGRSSFSNLLTLGHRFRQGSEPYSSRQGSPGLAVNGGTPGIGSNSNSFSISREALRVTLPERLEGESAGKYLIRVEECVDRSQIPSVLSKQHDEFFLAVMRSFMRKFAFFGDPLDMAIRKLLMEVDLPKETQQIDRFLQSFADRYHECNPGIFQDAEKAYFIAFSILILQTDAFNRNNKRKMTKVDYRKNSSIDGVADEILDCFYDNIVYTPFIRVEDEIDLKTTIRKNKKNIGRHGAVEQLKNAAKEPLDPYALILDGRLDALRPPVREVMNLDDPYSYLGTGTTLDVKPLNRSSKCGVLQIESSRSRPDAFLSPTTIDNPEEARMGLVDLPVEKIGVLWRKDPKKKTARSPWQEWGAILTGSGLSFFRNVGWVKSMMHQYDSHKKHGHSEGTCIFRPPIPMFKPEYFLPTENGVALHDATYRRHKNAFVHFSQSGSEEVFLADSETEMNDWLMKLNHQASYRTAGIRPRGLIGGNYEGQRQRALRRLQSSNSTRTIQTPTGEVTIQSGNIDFLFAQQISAARRESMQKKIEEFEDRLSTAIKQLDGQLRDARHLLILAPIQDKTREQLVHRAGKMAAQLKWIRIEIWRMKCHRDILAQDLDEENKLAGGTLAPPRSPQVQVQPTSPSLSTVPSQERLSRVGGLLRLGSSVSSNLDVDHQPQPKSPVVSSRPGTKETQSSQDTERSEDEVYNTPPEGTPMASATNLPWGQDVESAIFRAGQLVGSPPRPDLLAAPSSVASSRRESLFLSEASDVDTPVADGRKLHITIPSTGSAEAPRPVTASDSEHEFATAAGSPESRSKVRRSLHRSLREGTPLSQRSHRRGKESGSSITSDNAKKEHKEIEKLSRAKGSFTVHGKKASVVTFGSEWQDMPPEDRLKLRKQSQIGDILSPVSAATDDNADGPTSAPARHGQRTLSVSSIQSSSGGARRASNATSASDGRSDIVPLQERRARKRGSRQSIAGVIESAAERTRRGSELSEALSGTQLSDAPEHPVESAVSEDTQRTQAVEA